MLVKEKLAYSNRLELAKDIVVNVKNDLKLMMERCKEKNEKNEQMLNTFLASEAVKTALAISNLQMTILEAEKHLSEYLAKQGEK